MLDHRRVFNLLFFIVNVFVALAEEEEKVIQYNTSNFADEIKKNNHFVMFYAPWCGHCKRLHPTWEQLAEMLNEEPESQVTIAKVDCTIDSDLCSENEVTGYPTLKFFKLGRDAVKFRGTRDLPSLTSFINEQLGHVPEERVTTPPEPVNGLVELGNDNFDNYVQNGKFFIKFYAPWCAHCQRLAPTWDDLAKSFEVNNNVGIGKIDCTINRDVCNKFEIKGYPTLLWIENGKTVEKYQGQRSHEELKSYVNKMLGESTDTSSEDENSINDSSVAILTADNFQQGITEGVSFVKFYAPWCGHCMRLAPTWEELGKKVVDKENIRIAKVDCTLDDNKELCNQQDIEGFPSLFLFKNGVKISEYNGPRNLEDLHEFVSKHFHHDEL